MAMVTTYQAFVDPDCKEEMEDESSSSLLWNKVKDPSM